MPQNRAFFTGNALFQFLVYNEASQRCFSVVFLVLYCLHLHPTQAPIGSPRHEDPPGTRGEKGGQASSEIIGLARRRVASTWPQPGIETSGYADWFPAAAYRRKGSGTRGNLRTWVWVYIGPTWLDMTPTTQEGDRYDRVVAVLSIRDSWSLGENTGPLGAE